MAAINYSLIFYCEALSLDKYSKTEKQLMWENNSNHEFLSSFLPSFLTSILSLVETVALDTVKMHNQHRRLHYFLGTNRHLHHFLKTNSNENTSSTHGTRLWFTTWMNAKQQQKNNNKKKTEKKHGWDPQHQSFLGKSQTACKMLNKWPETNYFILFKSRVVTRSWTLWGQETCWARTLMLHLEAKFGVTLDKFTLNR